MPNSTTKNQMPAVASNFALGFIVLCIVIYLLSIARAIVIPFVIAVFLWYLINAMARGFSTIKVFGKYIPRFFCFSFGILILLISLWEIFHLITENISHIAKSAPFYQQKLQEIIAKTVPLLQLEHEPTIRELIGHLNLGATLKIMVKALSGLAGKTIIVLFYTGFLLYEQRFFHKKISDMIADQKLEDHVHEIIKDIDIKMQRYIWVKTVVSALTGFLTFLTLKFFDVDFAVFWGLMAFFFNFIPYVGSLAAIALPSLIALVQFGDISAFLKVGTCLSLIQISIGHALDPFMLGKELNLSPIFIISSLAVWGMIWGVPGMFLSIPILAMMVITLSQFEKTKPIAILFSKTGVIEENNKHKKTHPKK